MNLQEMGGLMYEAGKVAQNILLFAGQGKYGEINALAPEAEKLKSKCAANNILVTFFAEYHYPTLTGLGMTLTPPSIGHWHLPQGTNYSTIYVHITIVFKFIFSGHPDMVADGFRVQIMNDPDDEDEPGSPPAKDKATTRPGEAEGGLTSIDETLRLLKDAGLDNLFEK